jgi:hypothetical protein
MSNPSTLATRAFPQSGDDIDADTGVATSHVERKTDAHEAPATAATASNDRDAGAKNGRERRSGRIRAVDCDRPPLLGAMIAWGMHEIVQTVTTHASA